MKTSQFENKQKKPRSNFQEAAKMSLSSPQADFIMAAYI